MRAGGASADASRRAAASGQSAPQSRGATRSACLAVRTPTVCELVCNLLNRRSTGWGPPYLATVARAATCRLVRILPQRAEPSGHDPGPTAARPGVRTASLPREFVTHAATQLRVKMGVIANSVRHVSLRTALPVVATSALACTQNHSLTLSQSDTHWQSGWQSD